ncbi:hypothetical protein D3C78_763970 [compost metagenome]
MEEHRVEFVVTFDKTAPTGIAATYLFDIQGKSQAPVPALSRNLFNAVDALDQVVPERCQVDGLWVAPGHPDHGNVMIAVDTQQRHLRYLAEHRRWFCGAGCRGHGLCRRGAATKQVGTHQGFAAQEVVGQFIDGLDIEQQTTVDRAENFRQCIGDVHRRNRVDAVTHQRRAVVQFVEGHF